jgi:acetylornithine/succinyldiaminopimelate/putrescine aminotransferase
MTDDKNPSISKPQLLQWQQAFSLEWKEIMSAYKDHINPGLLQIWKRLGFDKIRILSAEDVYYKDASDNRILDCWGGFGSLNLGHNHPRLVKARRCFDDAKHVEICHAFVPACAAVLAKNISTIMPGDLDVTYLCCTGSEAIEGALKLAEKYKANNVGKIIYTTNAMHGKTHGALSVTGHKPFQEHFKLLPGCMAVPFGDSNAMRKVMVRHADQGPKNEIIAVVLEPIQCGSGIIVPPHEYLANVKEMCQKFNALLIIDEVQTGFGRTGKMFAFEHTSIVPDIVTISKSFGGGKSPVAAYVARKKIFDKAYSSISDCILHSSTFSGMGGSCAMATETIHTLYDENLIENAAHVGRYFLTRLKDLESKYPDYIYEVRGLGLLIGLEFRNIMDIIPGKLGSRLPQVKQLAQGGLVALIANSLLVNHKILVGFTEFNRNVMRFEPPLTFTENHADLVVKALDTILSHGIVSMVMQTIKNKFI